MPQAIRTISFVGLGLIGTSLLRAFAQSRQEGKNAVSFKGYDPSLGEQEREELLGLGLDCFETDRAALYEADLIVLCAPILENIRLLGGIRRLAGASTLVADVSSTKAQIARRARELDLPFIGMHPMAGREQQGFRAAHEELLRGKTLILCDNGDYLQQPCGRALVTLLVAAGCDIVEMDPETHDRVVGNISHLPQLVSTLLVNHCETNVTAAGPGFASLARLAGSPWSVWQDIVLTNPSNIADELEGFGAELQALCRELRAGSLENLAEKFDNANRLYQLLKKRHKP